MLFKTFLVFCLSTISVALVSRTMEFRSARLVFSPNYFSNFTVTVAKGYISIDMELLEPLTEGFKNTMDFRLRLSDSTKYQSLVSYQLDPCSIVISWKDTLFRKWFKSLLRNGNFMDNCPVVPGRYYLNNWRLESTLIPTYFYPGDYRVLLRGYFGTIKEKEMLVDLETDIIIM